MALSTYIATAELISEQGTDVNKDIPMLIAHGVMDDVVPLSLGQQAVTTLEKQGYQPQWLTYPIDHSLCMEEIEAIGHWLQDILQTGNE